MRPLERCGGRNGPPGGCSVQVSCMTAIDIETANAAANGIETCANSLWHETAHTAHTAHVNAQHTAHNTRNRSNARHVVPPMNEERACPPTRLSGCESGEVGAAYNSTAVAP